MASLNRAEAPVVAFKNVTKRYGDIIAADNITLEIASGEFLSFLGPSGCGKTTSLRMIAGFDQPSEGEVLLEGKNVNGVPAYHRPVNMVFQNYALFPHLNVADNVAYGLRQRNPKPSRTQIDDRVTETLALVRLHGFEQRRIWEMSGGQQQRVALARALINKPKVLLLDEPLAALDRKLRRDMQIELQNLQRTVGITFILVTHDQEEALSMSDRVCIMREGAIVQIGTPRQLYDHPVSRYVADFVGKSNFFDGSVSKISGSKLEIELECGITVPSVSANDPQEFSAGDKVSVSIRPEQMLVMRDESNLPENYVLRTPARVLNRIFLGEHTEYLLYGEQLGEFLVLSSRQSELNESPIETGESVYVACNREAALVLGNI